MIGEETGDVHFDRAIKEIDACIFTGDDVSEDPRAKVIFQHYLARWLRATIETNPLTSEDDYVSYEPILEENAARSRRGLRK